jgi:hypothetical protein
MPMPTVDGAVAIGVRASSVLENVSRAMSAAGLRLLVSKMDVQPDAPAYELLQSIGAAVRQLSGPGGVLLLVDGYSDRSVRIARLFIEMRGAGSRSMVFMLPPMPYEKRLEEKFRFNVGFMANWLDVDGLLVDVALDRDSLSMSAVDFEATAMGEISAALSDFLGRSDRPPLSDLLEDGGDYVLLVGGFKGAKELALASALEGAPSVAVATSPSASELVLAASLASALGVSVDTVAGTVNYVVMRNGSMKEDDPIYAALNGRFKGGLPTLDMAPALPAKIDIPLDLYEL